MKQLNKKQLKQLNKSIVKHGLDIILILENIQYASNVAGLFRTADAAGVKEIIITGSSQKPPFGAKLQKASRSKEKYVVWSYEEKTKDAIDTVKRKGYTVVAVELTDESIDIRDFIKTNTTDKIALLVGNEVGGIGKETLSQVDQSIFLPMYGKGASLNVATASAVAIYNLVLLN